MKRTVKFWTKEEDDIIKSMEGVPATDLVNQLQRKRVFADRSRTSIYQRICLLRYSSKEIKYNKRGRPAGSKNVKVDKETKEVALPKGMSLDFTGKRITISDTYIKIYI